MVDETECALLLGSGPMRSRPYEASSDQAKCLCQSAMVTIAKHVTTITHARPNTGGTAFSVSFNIAGRRVLDITNDSTKIVDFLVPNNSATQTEATNPKELESILVRVSEYEQRRGEIQFKRGALGTKVSASTESTRTRKSSSATTQNSTSLSVMRVHNSHRVAKSL